LSPSPATSSGSTWERHQAETSGDRFVAALDLADSGKTAESIAALQDITTDGTGAYPALARFAIASQKADGGDATGAVADFDAIAARGDIPQDMRNMARLRAAMILVDSATVAEVTRRVGDLAAVGNPWRNNAREVLALAAWHAGDFTAAKNYFQQLYADQAAQDDMRQRAQVMLSLIAAKQTATPTAAAPAAPATREATPAPAPAKTEG